MTYSLMCFFQSILLILFTPLFIAILKKFKAFLRGYKGIPILQIYFDLIKLFRKGRFISDSSSFITLLTPVLSFAAAITTAFLIPVFYTLPHNYFGHIFMIFFLLSIMKFLNVLLGLDCASGFGDLGASREMFISTLAEPVVFLIITFLYFQTNSFNFFEIAHINNTLNNYTVAHIMTGIAFLIVILAENARVPVDNPETHLELTMIHEAMVLDLSGSDLALIEYSSYLKFIIFLTLFINGFIPFGIAESLSIASIFKGMLFFSLKLISILFIIAILETSMAKFRLFRVPELLASAFSVAMVALTINYFM
ncbi:Formate hydrogenlyase subunit 4 [Desulfonispora thiosulfatigenes DSM 11270]|uniref:Formate hydrogenlyase subunit 4 n=1 Tax=Desulfonispora thiosulfatigenes DSM 11270 TaxID=656914 RepID=A0A1W1VC69_DESTI|nr:NADH-quinone oxidoreductase subunit H [Desulfonispora thiosulfatigenes]SMB90790.1 Formate hydrogenlyase subunit 4 [Desulfonispora thiosulfatigenes DSM 11270]